MVVFGSEPLTDPFRLGARAGRLVGREGGRYRCGSSRLSPRHRTRRRASSTGGGKVNQHVDARTGEWQTDPDGTYGADIDMLGYCRKWYPATAGVEEYRYETILDWKAAGNTGSYVGTHLSHRCVVHESSQITR
jgi:hypothetical protein